MADLEANFMHLQLLNESIARFNENFAAFLYGLNMTAFCVDFPEASDHPIHICCPSFHPVVGPSAHESWHVSFDISQGSLIQFLAIGHAMGVQPHTRTHRPVTDLLSYSR